MAKIIQLEQHVADLIAAGEVVSRPASVVKELLENAIDAGSSSVTVEITSGGMSSIRVTDNGCGIAPEDVTTAFLRHATSKLKDASGLEAIGTLGFRGEALAAIAAVSRIDLLTRTPESDEGVRLLLQAGTPSEPVPAGCPVGTTIIVRDLFFNTPARLKFMKSDRAEGSAVSSTMLRVALSRPDLSIRYIKDGKTEFHTPGDSKIDSCIYTLLGRDLASELIPVDLSDENVSVKGYISAPNAFRGNRSYQFFFINGRTVRSLLLQSALEQAYKNILMSGRFPSCVLYITAGLGSVDVNVHPAKTEVRFISDKQFFDGVYYAALGALENLQSSRRGEPCVLPRAETSSAPTTSIENSHQHSQISANHNFMPNNSASCRDDRPPGTATGGPRTSAIENFSQVTEYHYNYNTPKTDHTPEPPETFTPIYQQPYRFVGEVFNTYIIVERDDNVCFIDKHAAHERIHYDALRKGEYTPMSEMLLTPIVCRVGFDDASLLLENERLLDNLGFTVESFGEDAVAVRHIPSDIRQADVEAVLADICRQLDHGTDAQPSTLDKIYKIIACKAAIKAGSNSDAKELEALAARVMSGEILQCPHGRPVTVEISKSALERQVGRL